MAEIQIDSVRATYDIRGEKVVLMCPPHPLMGGSRFDIRLDRISNDLLKNGISTLRFDYRQPFRGGIGEIEDAELCLGYLKERHSFIAVLGYSFGSVVASNIAEYCDAAVYISPMKRINSIEFEDSAKPKLFIVALKDQFVSLEESLDLFDRSSDPKKLVKIDTDHFYFGRFDVLVGHVRNFLLSFEDRHF
jgi:hypothetical protein